jgi:hypothetical protein
MGRWLKSAVLLMSVALVMLLVTGCCCPVPFFSGNNGTKDKASTTQQKTTKTTTNEAKPPMKEYLVAGEKDLVSNGDFSQNLAGWTIRKQPGSKVAGDNSAVLAGSDRKYLEVKRTNGDQDGGGAYAAQDINKDVSSYTSLIVAIAVNVVSEDGGNLANIKPQWFPEGACQVRVFYTAADGTDKEWYHGFYASSISGADADHFTQVTMGEWTKYASPNLMASTPAPKTIKKIEVYGFGWNFDGYITAVQAIAK